MPSGNLKGIKNGINSSSGNLFKNHMLSSLFHENCFWNTSLMLLASYSWSPPPPVWLQGKGQLMAGDKWGVAAAWQERWMAGERGMGLPLPCYGQACYVHGHLLQGMEPTEEAPEGMAITLACEGWLRFRQAERGEKSRWAMIWWLTRARPMLRTERRYI